MNSSGSMSLRDVLLALCLKGQARMNPGKRRVWNLGLHLSIAELTYVLLWQNKAWLHEAT